MARVLVVDDEEIYLRATAGILRKHGFTVETALGGERALELVADHVFDAAVVDLMMPRINGLEVLRKIHARQPQVRVILTSAFPLSPSQIERLGLGDVLFVPKPCRVETLVAAIEGRRPSRPTTPGQHVAPARG